MGVSIPSNVSHLVFQVLCMYVCKTVFCLLVHWYIFSSDSVWIETLNAVADDSLTVRWCQSFIIVRVCSSYKSFHQALSVWVTCSQHFSPFGWLLTIFFLLWFNFIICVMQHHTCQSIENVLYINGHYTLVKGPGFIPQLRWFDTRVYDWLRFMCMNQSLRENSAGCMNYLKLKIHFLVSARALTSRGSANDQQGEMKIPGRHFWWAVMASIWTYRLCSRPKAGCCG